MQAPFPHLFSPITIGGITFKNRIWSAPAGVHLLAGLDEYPNEAVIAYYANKAKGGVRYHYFFSPKHGSTGTHR